MQVFGTMIKPNVFLIMINRNRNKEQKHSSPAEVENDAVKWESVM